MMGFIIIGLVVSVGADEVGKINRKANRLYGQGKYEEALRLYDEALLLDPSDGKLKMNRGAALYRMGNLEEAEEAYAGALGSSKGKKADADAYYNMGNIQYKQGEQLEAEGNAAQARGKYSQALENYINTLKLRPEDKDAKWNLQLAHQKVGLLENQEDQQQQNQDGQDKREDKDGESQNQEGKDEQNEQDEQQQQQQQQQDQSQDDQEMKKEEAERLIEQYADDSDSLNKPKFQKGRVRQPDKDW